MKRGIEKKMAQDRSVVVARTSPVCGCKIRRMLVPALYPSALRSL
jgi:hypothetical protein